MTTPRNRRTLHCLSQYRYWAADNGCFLYGASFQLDTYLAWLERMAPQRVTCLFATAPDVVGDWAATWARSREALPAIRERGYRAALVAQDGMTTLPNPAQWDVFFCGGTTDFKLSETAYRLAADAKTLGKWCHMGRVNSWRRIRAAALSGYDSADGTHLAFRPDARIRQVQAWMRALKAQPPLPLFAD